MTNQTAIQFIATLDGAQQQDLLALYRNEFWCHSRRLPDVEKMLRHTDILIGAVSEQNKLIGFVRVLTDYVYKATIYDLIVHPQYRKQGLGEQLMEQVMNHPDLQGVAAFDLHCLPAMHGFYAKWGFSTDLGELTFMRCDKQVQ